MHFVVHKMKFSTSVHTIEPNCSSCITLQLNSPLVRYSFLEILLTQGEFGFYYLFIERKVGPNENSEKLKKLIRSTQIDF